MIRTLFQDTANHKWTPSEIQFVLYVCNNEKSWGPKIQQVTSNESPQWILMIWTPAVISRLYPSIGPDLSLTHHRGGTLPILTIFNDVNWTRIPKAAQQSGYTSLDQYRIYLINHEFGHMLGLGHAKCGGRGQLCPVMVQQTKGTQGCIPCVWPQICGDVL